jgi:hypothetical protein
MRRPDPLYDDPVFRDDVDDVPSLLPALLVCVAIVLAGFVTMLVLGSRA